MNRSNSTSSTAGARLRFAVPAAVLLLFSLTSISMAAYSVGRVSPLTRERETDAKPSFSPDGTKVVFVSGRQGNKDLWIMNADGTDPYRLTAALSPFQFYDDPAWSPDGKRIACASNRGSRGNPDIWIIDLERATQLQLTDNESIDWMPTWSPDGSQIAFVSDRNGADSLWVMQSDGSNPRLLVTGAWDPSWSPDGSIIAYFSLQPGKGGTWVIPCTGGEPNSVVRGLEQPSWSPNGSKLVGVMQRDSRRELWFASRGGGAAREAPAAGGSVSSPDWSPQGDSIVFDAALHNNQDVFVLQLRRQPPVAVISHPPADARVQGIVDILGSLNAATGTLKSGRVDYGVGENPSEWVSIRENITAPVQDGLLARWDTSGLSGVYTLRVAATDEEEDTAFATRQVKLLSDFGVEYLQHNTPTTMIGSQVYTVDLTLRNVGTMTWLNSGNNAVQISYRWIDDKGRITHGLKSPLPVPVNYEEQAVVQAQVRAPAEQGKYILEWDLRQGELLWFSQRNTSPIRVGVNVEVPYSVMFIGGRTPERMTPSQQYTVEVTIRNTGATSWQGTGEQPVGMGYHWYNMDGTPLDDPPLITAVPAVVPSGTEVKVDARVRAPDVQGKYVLRWDLRLGGNTWFSDMGATSLEAPVTVVSLYGVEYEERVIPSSMTPGEIYIANLRLKNTGSMKWYYQGPNAIGVGYRWIDDQGNTVSIPTSQPGGALTSLPYDVDPGRSAGVVAQVQSPVVPGTYTLQWDLVQGNSLWFSTQGSRPLDVGVIVARPSYAATFTARSHPNNMIVGQLYTVSISIRNTGTLTWALGGRNPVKLGYHWIDESGNNVESLPILTDLQRPVSLGEEVTLNAQTRAPDMPGVYTLKWDLFQEGQGWFSNRGASTVNIPVAVDSLYLAKFLSHDSPKTQVAGQTYTVRIRIQNTGALRWESGGPLPVQLSYRWLSGSGRTVVTKGLLTNLSTSVSKGDTVDVVARIQAPETPGDYTLKWDLIQGDLIWFAEKGSNPLEVQVDVR